MYDLVLLCMHYYYYSSTCDGTLGATSPSSKWMR